MWHELVAIQAGVAGAGSNGQTEGRVNRPKLVERTGYGWAGFAPLKARVPTTG